MKDNKSPRVDGIQPKLLIARVCNLSLKEGVVPFEWKEANIIPLCKKGNKSENYRPVSLTSVIYKLLERRKVPHQRLLLIVKAHGIGDGIIDWIKKWLTTLKEKDLGITSADKKVSEQCDIAASNGNEILGLTRRNIKSREKELIITLYTASVRPHLEYCMQAWKPYRKKNADMLERK